MTSRATAVLLVLGLLVGCRAAQPAVPLPDQTPSHDPLRQAAIVVPGPTNAVRFRLYTNAAPDAAHLFNTFELEAHGETLLRSPAGAPLQRWLAAPPADPSLHNVLVNGRGPDLASANSMTVLEQASGPDWSYVALDVSAAYRGRVELYKRGILFVEPDLFILWDHLIASEPVNFQILLHAPAATRLDPVWHDLRLDLPRAGVRIHAPAPRKQPRDWQQIPAAADAVLADTVTMRIGPTNRLAQIDLVTVFAVHRGGEKKELAFRLLEGREAVGARIHREGLPTLVAFKTNPSAHGASLTGFDFTGPVGVSVFRPKPLRPLPPGTPLKK